MPVSPWRAVPLIVFTLIMMGAPVAHASVVGSDGADARAPHTAATQDDEQSVQGTLRKPNGDPLSDVTVIASVDGKKVGSSTSKKDGSWSIAVPSSGDYTVELQLDTLPKSMHPRDEGGQTLDEVSVRSGQARTVIFPLVPKDTAQKSTDASESQKTSSTPDDAKTAEKKAAASGSSFLSRLAQRLVLGLKLGIIIAITAIGLSLVFGTTRLINFAHGELVVAGAVSAYFFSVTPFNMPLVVATILAIGVVIILAIIMERGIWRNMRRRQTGMIQMFVVSIGISLFLRHVILVLYGSRRHLYDQYTVQQALSWGPISLAPRDLFIMGLSLLVLLGTAFMLLRTRIGKATRAVADNRDLASASGIDVDRVILVVWILGGGLAAFGGVMYGLTEAVYWDMGFNLLLLMFAGVILGGLGSAFGAVVGGIVIGLVAQLSTLWFPSELQNAWALLVLILVLLFRPQGILGRAERAG